MNYVNVKILPRPHNIEFKCVGGLIFDINYVDYGVGPKRWLNSKGLFHRENGPAIIWDSGRQYWYRYDKYHREDGPAGIWSNGKQFWCLNDSFYFEEDFKKEIRRRNELRKSKNLTNTL